MKEELEVLTEKNIAEELHRDNDVMDVTRDALWVESKKGFPCLEWGFWQSRNVKTDDPRFGNTYILVCPPGLQKWWKEWAKTNGMQKDLKFTVQPTLFHVSTTEGELLEGYDGDEVLAEILKFAKNRLVYVDTKRKRNYEVRSGIRDVVKLLEPEKETKPEKPAEKPEKE